MLAFESVVRRYARRGAVTRALDGLSLSIAPGEFVAVIGPSGSGKSTLLHLAAALDLPSEGRTLIDGRDTGAMTEQQRTDLRRKRIGLVFQFFNLLPTLTIERNVALPLLIDGRRFSDARPRVASLLERVGLDARAGALPEELSGGEMQRVAIARALAIEPALLLADEPTGNLDSATSAAIMTIIRDTAETNGRTTMLVTHDMSVAAQADRVIRIRDGRVDESENT
jgi:putative ABC transport system ATP-binding protein